MKKNDPRGEAGAQNLHNWRVKHDQARTECELKGHVWVNKEYCSRCRLVKGLE